MEAERELHQGFGRRGACCGIILRLRTRRGAGFGARLRAGDGAAGVDAVGEAGHRFGWKASGGGGGMLVW